MNKYLKRIICMFHPQKRKDMILIDKKTCEYECKVCGCRWFIYY